MTPPRLPTDRQPTGCDTPQRRSALMPDEKRVTDGGLRDWADDQARRLAAELDDAPAPSPAVEPPHDLREALVRWLAQRYSDGSALEMRGIRDDADALLAGPLAPLLDRLSRAEAATVDFHRATDAEARGEGICRTCLAPIWNEGGTVSHRKRAEGWSDRIERGGDSLVCFKAVDYRHVPLAGREAAIYDRAYARAALSPESVPS